MACAVAMASEHDVDITPVITGHGSRHVDERRFHYAKRPMQEPQPQHGGQPLSPERCHTEPARRTLWSVCIRTAALRNRLRSYRLHQPKEFSKDEKGRFSQQE